jgi:hypothetical protein
MYSFIPSKMHRISLGESSKPKRPSLNHIFKLLWLSGSKRKRAKINLEEAFWIIAGSLYLPINQELA